MLRWPHFAGIVIGGVLGASLLRLVGGPGANLESGPALSECDGHLRELVIHYETGAKRVALPVYSQFLPALEPDVTVRVLCQDVAAYRELEVAVGSVRCKLVPVIVRHPITTWSRDRWVALPPHKTGGPTTLWCPRREAAEEIWPARAGDQRVAADLAAASAHRIRARRSSLYFDGGDFLADSENVFIMPRVLHQNIQHTAANRAVLLSMLGAELKRHMILLEEAPNHHAGMFMASIGRRTMLVGDPSLAKPFAPPLTTPGAGLPDGADFSAPTQRLFDAVARQCAAAGYRVIRIPTMVGEDGRTYFTYVNALIDEQPTRRVVYLPSYKGQDAMNLAARSVWESQGYETRAIDCTSTYQHGGCLHCLVNVIRRDPGPNPRTDSAQFVLTK